MAHSTSLLSRQPAHQARAMRISAGEAGRQLMFGVWIVAALALATVATLMLGVA